MASLQIPQREDIKTLVTKVKNKELKIVDLIQAHLNLAHDINPEINAFITILDNAIDRAKELDAKIESGEIELEDDSKYQLLGVPFTVKDLYLVEGTKTTFSSKYMEDFIAPYTATIVQKCLDEGAILIGKCNSDPWGFGGSGENSGYGSTKHPLDFTKTPGGSSSGSAASLLAGVGYFALATDTGGSVRLPASFCGLYGFKPTYGQNSRYGIGAMASSFDTPGFFTRYLSDVTLVEDIIKGKDERDASSYDLKGIKPTTKLVKDISIGILKEYSNNDTDFEANRILNEKINILKDKGVKIKEISIPTIDYALSVYYILVPSEISSNMARYDGVRFGPNSSDNYEENLVNSRSANLEEEVKRRIMIGTYSLSAGYSDEFYKKASLIRSKLKREFIEAFKEVDLILAPVSPVGAFEIGEKSKDPLAMYLVDIYTVVANVVGIPSLAIPAGKDSSNMPLGVQLMANYFHEDLIYKASELIL